MTERTATLDFDADRPLHEAVAVPLVLHGSSGVADPDLTRAVEAGMTKVNIATHLNNVFTATVRQILADNPNLVDTRKYLGPARDAVATEVARLLAVLNAVSATHPPSPKRPAHLSPPRAVLPAGSRGGVMCKLDR